MGSAAMLGAMGTGVLGCTGKIGDSEHDVLFSPMNIRKPGRIVSRRIP